MPDGDAQAYAPKTYGAHPDAIARRRMLSERARVTTRLILAMHAPMRVGPDNGGGNPHPQNNGRSRSKTCPACQTTYPRIRGYFTANSIKCLKCCQAKRTKTCGTCGTEYVGVIEHFRRGGNIHPTCNACAACAEAKVRAKIEARIARGPRTRTWRKQRAADIAEATGCTQSPLC